MSADTATITDLANAVTHELNTDAFSLDFTPTMRFRPTLRKRDLGDTVNVQVVPEAKTLAQASRGTIIDAGFTVNVGIIQRLDGSSDDDEAQLANLMAFVEEVADAMSNKALTQLPAASWVETAADPIYDPERVEEDRVFLSVIALTYRIIA